MQHSKKIQLTLPFVRDVKVITLNQPFGIITEDVLIKILQKGSAYYLHREKLQVASTKLHAIHFDRKFFHFTMADDTIVRLIRHDELIILFGNKLCDKYKDPHFYDMIRQKLRQLGRFLYELRKYCADINDLFSVFYPKNYDHCISAIESLAGLRDKTNLGFSKNQFFFFGLNDTLGS